MQRREDEHDLIRAVASAMRHIRDFGQQVHSRGRAERLLFRVMQQRCGWAGASMRHGQVYLNGTRRSLKALTFKHTKLPLRLWLAAIWHLHVDEQSIAARVFGRRYGIDKMSAWRLLMRVRRAFITFVPSCGAVRSQSLGRQNERNEAWCAATVEFRRLFVINAEDAPPIVSEDRTGALFLGYFKQWLVTQFRGVSEANHAFYAAEYSDRYRRIAVNAARA